LDASYTRT